MSNIETRLNNLKNEMEGFKSALRKEVKLDSDFTESDELALSIAVYIIVAIVLLFVLFTISALYYVIFNLLLMPFHVHVTYGWSILAALFLAFFF